MAQTIGNKSTAELNKEFEDLSRLVRKEASRCSEQETPNCNDSRRNKDQVWISDPNEDDSSSEFDTDAKDSDASRNGDKNILNHENVAVNMTGVCNTENDRSEGELSDSSSDEFDTENVDSMLEETLRQSRQHIVPPRSDVSQKCSKRHEFSGSPEYFGERASRDPMKKSEKRKREHSPTRESMHKRQRSRSPELSLSPTEKSGSFLGDACVKLQTLVELTQKADKVLRQVELELIKIT